MAVSAALVCRSLTWTFCAVLSQSGQEVPNSGVPTFGTTVVASSGLRGDIYFVPPGIDALPSFKHLKPVGTIYANRLDIPPRDFKEGFPGITGRFEWFAIDYHGRFFIQARTRYQFGLSSDDGSKLYIDGHLAIDNDGIHAPSGCTAKVELGPGIHTIRISYLQGPGWLASLRLFIAEEGRPWRAFDTREFTPPEDSKAWSDAGRPSGGRTFRKLSGGDCWAG